MKKLRMMLPLAAMTIAWAQPYGPGPQAPAFDNLKTYLGISDTTIQSIQQAIQKTQSTIQPLVQQIGEKHRAVADLLAKGSTDAAAIGKLILDAEAIRKQIRTQHDALQSTAQSFLTADQKTKLKALEDAAKLAPAIHEAVGLHLVTGPEGAGPGGPGMGPGMGPGNMGGGRGPGVGPMGPGFGSGFMPRGRTPRS